MAGLQAKRRDVLGVVLADMSYESVCLLAREVLVAHRARHGTPRLVLPCMSRSLVLGIEIGLTARLARPARRCFFDVTGRARAHLRHHVHDAVRRMAEPTAAPCASIWLGTRVDTGMGV